MYTERSPLKPNNTIKWSDKSWELEFLSYALYVPYVILNKKSYEQYYT